MTVLQTDAFIFELDDVVCRTRHCHRKAWEMTMDLYGIPRSQEAVSALCDISREEDLKILLEKYDAHLPEEQSRIVWATKTRLYAEELNVLSPDSLLPGVLSTLLTLKSRGYQIAIGSSDWNARTVLCNLGICRIFDAIIDGTLIQKGKPDPEVYLSAASALSLPNSRCTVIDSAISGILAAKAGGFCAIATGNAKGCALADMSISRLSDLLGVIP